MKFRESVHHVCMFIDISDLTSKDMIYKICGIIMEYCQLILRDIAMEKGISTQRVDNILHEKFLM